MAVLTNWTFHR